MRNDKHIAVYTYDDYLCVFGSIFFVFTGNGKRSSHIVFNDAFLSFFRCGAGSNGGHYLIMEPVGNLVFKQGKMNAINSADYLLIKMG